jgi:hypothetical protein
MNHPAHTTQSTRLPWLPFAGFTAMCLTVVLIPQSAAAAVAPTHGQIQERLGQTILMVTQHDQALLQAHLDQMTELMQERNQFQQGRYGRLQQALGQSIIDTAQAIRTDQLDLKSRIRITRQELALLSEDSPAGRQTQMGWAVRTAALRAAQEGTAFQTELGQEITRLEKVRQRTILRLNEELAALTRQEAGFASTIPQRYQEAVTFALQTVQMEDGAYLASVDQQILERSHQVMLRQSPHIYTGLADLTRTAMARPAGVGGFIEYGLAAMAGAIGVLVWFGLSKPRARSVPDTPRMV